MKKIESLLYTLSITNKYKGFNYIVDSVEMICNDQNLIVSKNTQLYPKMARKHNTTISSIERNIRTVIKIIWKNGNNIKLSGILNETIGYQFVTMPSTGEFLNILAVFIKETK